MIELEISVELDQYPGNVDEFVCAALTNSGVDRHGMRQGSELFEKTFGSRKDKDTENDPLHSDFFSTMPTEYGDMPYRLDELNSNCLVIGLSGYDTTPEDAKNIVATWREGYPDGKLTFTRDYDDKPVEIKILGYTLITREINEKRQTL